MAAGPQAGRIEKPSATTLARPVVVRALPLPGPPTLRAKLETIRQNGCAPVPSSVANRIRQVDGRDAVAGPAVIPAVRSDGRMTLTPKHPDASTPRPQPIKPAPARADPRSSPR